MSRARTLANFGGVTSSATELNALDGITADVTELNLLDGQTDLASQAELDAVSTTVTANESDADKIQTNIALLGFKVAVNGSLAKYDLQDQIVDEFVVDEDHANTGIDDGASTNHIWTAGVYSSSSMGTSSHNTSATTSTVRTSGPDMRANDGSWESYFDGNWSTGEDTKDWMTYVGGWFQQYWSTAVIADKAAIRASGTAATLNYKIEASNDGSSWTLIHTGTDDQVMTATPYGNQQTWTNTTAYNYWRLWILEQSHTPAGEQTNPTDTNEVGFWTKVGIWNDMTLQSIDTAAEAVPTKADMVMLIQDSAGTATVNTDIKGYVSRDSGSTFIEGTLVDEGHWGVGPSVTGKRILAFHDLSFTGASGQAMCYKITTHNQTSSKETKIHATSIGWR